MKKLGISMIALLLVAGIIGFIGCKQPTTPEEKPLPPGLKVLADGTDGTAGKKWTYVEFGIWPQTKYRGSENALKTCANINAWDNCYTDGNGGYYVKVKATPYFPVGEYTTDSDYYFKLEPIQWRVLTNDYNGKKLLLAEKALGNCAYFPYTSSNATRTISGEGTVYNNNYKHSEVRAFLNGYDYVNPDNSTNTIHNNKGFLQKAFTPEQINAIANTDVDNSCRSTFSSGDENGETNKYACANTTDKIFLLSEKEVTTKEYGFDVVVHDVGDSNGTKTSARLRRRTDYATATGIYFSSNDSPCEWWLRSPSRSTINYARYVDNVGAASSSNDVKLSYLGVVPALSISF